MCHPGRTYDLSNQTQPTIYLNDSRDRPDVLDSVRCWIGIVGKYIAIRDALALSFALDFDRVDGNPNNQPSEIGQLREQAKPYGRSLNNDTYNAADKLVVRCKQFLDEMSCYRDNIDSLVGMPSRAPNPSFSLTNYIASQIAKEFKIDDLTPHVRTRVARKGLKEVDVRDKLNIIRGTIDVDEGEFRGRKVLIIEDLYQAGVSVNYMGMLLQQGGARKIFGLACDKTCRNDHNVGA